VACSADISRASVRHWSLTTYRRTRRQHNLITLQPYLVDPYQPPGKPLILQTSHLVSSTHTHTDSAEPRTSNIALALLHTHTHFNMRVTSAAPFRYPPTPSSSVSSKDETYFEHAVSQASIGLDEGGVPIGGALVITEGDDEGKILGVGRNKRVQLNSATRHGEARSQVLSTNSNRR
jgi:hypothetical protein